MIALGSWFFSEQIGVIRLIDRQNADLHRSSDCLAALLGLVEQLIQDDFPLFFSSCLSASNIKTT